MLSNNKKIPVIKLLLEIPEINLIGALNNAIQINNLNIGQLIDQGFRRAAAQGNS